MKKLILILSLICFISCAVNDCVVITRKENIGDNFLFFFQNGNNLRSVMVQTKIFFFFSFLANIVLLAQEEEN